MGDFHDFLKVFGGAASALALYILGSKVFEAVGPKLIERIFQQQDKKRLVHETNQGKQIDFDVIAFQRMADRLEKVEGQLEKIQEKLTSQMVENATFKVENEHLREKEKEQAGEIRLLRESNRKLLESDREKDVKILSLQTQLDTAQTQITILGEKIDSLTKLQKE